MSPYATFSSISTDRSLSPARPFGRRRHALRRRLLAQARARGTAARALLPWSAPDAV